MGLYRRGKIFWFTIMQNRKRIQVSTKTENKKLAGMRRGEILNLLWKDVDFFRKLVTVVKSKNGEKRGIPMSQTLYNTLKSISKVVDISSRVFPISVRSL
jgi:integrase